MSARDWIRQKTMAVVHVFLPSKTESDKLIKRLEASIRLLSEIDRQQKKGKGDKDGD